MRILLGIVVVAGALVLAAGFSHRILPAEWDDCQQDITHMGHTDELPMFHCIGHSEGGAAYGWDHVHPWMTEDWHLERDLPLTGGVAPDDASEN